ncbi:conserved Plasmodium protein, unknown function [Plasmodium relictum]|uniref:Uncharacterized protein n=1 Tax=Plasmodium relictum TaxID=85471 RepID=A0A1J1H967_PLARL|nr:conserved Plasmodium protein, unknown function [Plasmodium relictum]CRH01055.1 conserved Plasmodium protein, unknown function [Plasmodium relictum]
MKNFYCFFYFCNLFLTSRKKTFYNLKKNKIRNIGNIKIYDTNDNYNYLEKIRNSEYEDILDEIINEYEEKKKREEDNNGIDNKNNNLQENLDSNNVNKDNNSENGESKKRDEIKRIQQQKENNILNLCNLNYDLLNILLKKELEKNKNDDEDKHYNKFSLFLEIQNDIRNKKMYIDDSVGRYFLNIDNIFVNTISERELHFLKNEIYKNIIYLKYKYLKSYKSTIHDLKQIKQNKTEEINKHVSIVHEDEDSEELVNKNDYADDNSNYTKYNGNESKINNDITGKKEDKENTYTNKISLNDLNKDHIHSSNSEYIKNIDEKLSIESLKEIIDVKQRLSILQKNFDDLKNLNIADFLSKNNFLNDLNVHNFIFYNYNCHSLDKTMKNFVKKIHKGDISKNIKKNDNEINSINKNEKSNSFSKEEGNDILKDAENNYSYICIPKMSDYNFFKSESRSIIINLSSQIDDEKKSFQKINELNIDTDKGILVLSGNEKNLNVSVRNICDKISYLSQSFTIYPQLNYNENISKNKKIILRILMLMLFYFKIKNLYVICLDDKSTKFFYEFMKNSGNNLLMNFCKNKKDEYLFVDLDKIKFSHVFSRNFVPLFSIDNIFKNHVFMMNKEENIFDINFFKRSCLFIFLNEHGDKKNVISSSVQHFFYYKKFDYPFIYNIDKKYSLETLKKFNEILLYITSWIDIFHTSENENNSKNNEELDDDEHDEKDDEDENSELSDQNDDENDEDNYEKEDEREGEGYFGKDIDRDEENENY